jgi:hypothetical protein
MKLKPLDIVRTPKGGIAVITESGLPSKFNNNDRHSIDFIDNPYREYNAWWNDNELQYLTSIPALLTNAMAHPFGNNKKLGEKYFPKEFKPEPDDTEPLH